MAKNKIKVVLINVIKDLECPPLTLAYLGTYIRKYNNVEVKIIDINFDNIFKEVNDFKPDLIGLSAHTITFNSAKKIAGELKKQTNAKIIIGGVHISTHPASFGKEFDIGILGEGEKILSKIIDLIEKNNLKTENLRKIKGIIFWNNGKTEITAEKELEENIDDIPAPDRTMLNKNYFKQKISYNKLKGEKVIEAGMMTSRGCPYNCSFCSAAAFWRKIRFHSPEYVAKEIKDLIDNFNVNYIVVYDDFFAISVDRLRKIREEMEKNKTLGKVKFSCSARVNVITDKLCEEMKKLGIITVNFGFESGSDKIIKMLKGESVTVKQNIDAAKMCIKYGFDVTGSFIVGSPEEKIEDTKKTLEVIKKMRKIGVSEIWCGIAVPYPKTKLWDYAVKNNLLKDFKWDVADPSYVHSTVFLDKDVNKKEFLKIFRQIKDECQGINPQHQSGIIKKIKERVYYNKFLYDFSSKMMGMMPSRVKKVIFYLTNIRGNLLTK